MGFVFGVMRGMSKRAMLPADIRFFVRAARSLVLAGLVMTLSGCGSDQQSVLGEPKLLGSIRIQLDAGNPSASTGTVEIGDGPRQFKVGYGREGIACAGTTFQEGVTPLGTFRVNAILSDNDFAMEPELVALSGKSEDELRKTLFRNMNSIDFKGDGETGEYGIGYISLAPVPATEQPFRFNTYDGRFRWYSFAIHGTNEPSRVGKAVTGGCINVDQNTLRTLLETVKLGDEVVISSDGPCLS